MFQLIVGTLGWQTYSVVNPSAGDDDDSSMPVVYPLPSQVELSGLPKSASLGVLGVNGIMAYLGKFLMKSRISFKFKNVISQVFSTPAALVRARPWCFPPPPAPPVTSQGRSQSTWASRSLGTPAIRRKHRGSRHSWDSTGHSTTRYVLLLSLLQLLLLFDLLFLQWLLLLLLLLLLQWYLLLLILLLLLLQWLLILLLLLMPWLPLILLLLLLLLLL